MPFYLNSEHFTDWKVSIEFQYKQHYICPNVHKNKWQNIPGRLIQLWWARCIHDFKGCFRKLNTGIEEMKHTKDMYRAKTFILTNANLLGMLRVAIKHRHVCVRVSFSLMIFSRMFMYGTEQFVVWRVTQSLYQLSACSG